jgi:hypothetical protein
VPKRKWWGFPLPYFLCGPRFGKLELQCILGSVDKGRGVHFPSSMRPLGLALVCWGVFLVVPLSPSHAGGPSHRAGRSVFSAMKLGKNRPHKEEPLRQGRTGGPAHGSVRPLAATSTNVTTVELRSGPHRLPWDWSARATWAEHGLPLAGQGAGSCPGPPGRGAPEAAREQLVGWTACPSVWKWEIPLRDGPV